MCFCKEGMGNNLEEPWIHVDLKYSYRSYLMTKTKKHFLHFTVLYVFSIVGLVC